MDVLHSLGRTRGSRCVQDVERILGLYGDDSRCGRRPVAVEEADEEPEPPEAEPPARAVWEHATTGSPLSVDRP